jgi:hypothetical protein
MKKCFERTLIYPIGYPFIREYLHRKVNIFWDDTKSLNYVFHDNKRMFFKKGLTNIEIRDIYNSLCIEQDIRSPHSYFSFPVYYQATDIAVDVGAAEGIWALGIVEKVKEVYLFECEESWIEALHATFEPWKNKVYIVNKYVTDFIDVKNTTLDAYFNSKNAFPTIIKADLEGAEIACVKGAETLLSRHVQHALLCTYHNFGDYEVLSEMMKKYHFEIQPSVGYMVYFWEELNYSCKDITKIFRKGLIHASKKTL